MIPTRADVQAEPLVDVLSVTERELRAAAAGVEHDERAPTADPEPGGRGEVGETALLLAGDHLDLDAGALPHGVEEACAVGRAAQSGRSDRRDRLGALTAGFCGHRRDRLDRALHRPRLEQARVVEPFAEARDLGAVDDRAPLAVRGTLADVELDRVRTDIDDRVAPRAEAGERL